jgi:hypothetical protein
VRGTIHTIEGFSDTDFQRGDGMNMAYVWNLVLVTNRNGNCSPFHGEGFAAGIKLFAGELTAYSYPDPRARLYLMNWRLFAYAVG